MPQPETETQTPRERAIAWRREECAELLVGLGDREQHEGLFVGRAERLSAIARELVALASLAPDASAREVLAAMGGRL